MAANFDPIDLNSDVVSIDRGMEVCESNVTDNTFRVGESGAESVGMVPVDEIRDLGEAKVVVCGVSEKVVDGLGDMDLGREMEPLDRLSGVQAFDGEDIIDNAGGQEEGPDGLEEIAREEDMECNGISVVDRDPLSGLVAQPNLHRCEDGISTNKEKHGVFQPCVIASGESEGDRNANLVHAEEIPNQGFPVNSCSSQGRVGSNQYQDADATGSASHDAETNGEQIMNVCIPEAYQNESHSFSLVLDLNPMMAEYGNLKSGAHFGNQGIEVEDMLGHMELPGLGGEADGYANEVGSSANCVIASQNPTGNNGKTIVKIADSEQEFHVNDLVWGKVKSHPWWPGQIFDPSASSEKAKKYHKRDCFLIAYFGDQTFAWNEASRIKPFQAHFSQMEKQSNVEDFHYAVDCALDEVSRRVEYGLACSCLSEEVHARIKTQIIVNAGIREESSKRDGGDRFLSTISFDPMKLVEYIKALGRLPYGKVDRLELVIAQAQLLALYRWKGYSQLPEFNMLGDLLENDVDTLLSADVNYTDKALKAVSDYKENEQVPSGKGKLKNWDSSNRKRKHMTSDTKYPSKKEKSLSALMAEKSLYVLNGETGSERKAGKESPCLSISGKKRKVVNSMSDDLKVKQRKGSMSTRKSIMRRVEIENSSLDELLSQLFLAAKDPMKGYSFLISVIGFFSEFRNSVSLDFASSWKQDKSLEQAFVYEHGEISTKLGIIETPELDYMKDSYWTDMLIQSNSEDPLENWNNTGVFLPETPSEKGLCTFEPEAVLEPNTNLDSEQQTAGRNLDTCNPEPVLGLSNHLGSEQKTAGENLDIFEPEPVLESSTNLDSEQQTAGGNLELETIKPEGNLEDCCVEEISPTALILNFSYYDSVPSVTNLNKIFSRFGPLDESGTEVIQKNSRAKVIFKRRSDAETAFSSAGKYSIFGPSLVSYRLKYLPFTPLKASPQAEK